MTNLTDSAIGILKNYIDTQHNGVVSRAAHALGVPNMTLKQWVEGKRSPTLEALSPVFSILGIEFSTPTKSENAEGTIAALQRENAKLRAELLASAKLAESLERIVTAGLRREALPEESEDNSKKDGA